MGGHAHGYDDDSAYTQDRRSVATVDPSIQAQLSHMIVPPFMLTTVSDCLCTTFDRPQTPFLYAPNAACADALSARLPLASHCILSLTTSISFRLDPGSPQPPPPGVCITSRSPVPNLTVAFPPILILRSFPVPVESCLTWMLSPVDPGSPPSAPYGACTRRSLSIDTSIGWRNSSSRMTPFPPVW